MQRGMDIERQENRTQIEESRFAKEVKRIIITVEIPEYIGNNRKNKKGEMEITGRFRLGGENRSSGYWMKEEERKCRVCKEEEETLGHIFERCRYTKQEGKRWDERLYRKQKI